MAQYKDIDEILNNLPDDLPYKASVKRVLIQAPTADVTPKSEVAKIFEEIDLIFRNYYEKCSGTFELKLLEPLRQAERFIINEMWHDIAELKEKYTEDEGK